MTREFWDRRKPGCLLERSPSVGDLRGYIQFGRWSLHSTSTTLFSGIAECFLVGALLF